MVVIDAILEADRRGRWPAADRSIGPTRTPANKPLWTRTKRYNLEKKVAAGRFRQDLWQRLSATTLRVPSLRERVGEIPALTRLLVERYASAFDKPVRAVAPDAMAILRAFDWPGNVRQLEDRVRPYARHCDRGSGPA